MPSAAQSISVTAAAQSHPSPGQEDQGCSLDRHSHSGSDRFCAGSVMAAAGHGGPGWWEKYHRSQAAAAHLWLQCGHYFHHRNNKEFFSSECFLASFGVREQL